MNKIILLISLLFISLQISVAGLEYESYNRSNLQNKAINEYQDTSYLNQIIYNGVVWKGLFYNVYGTEFIFDDNWIDASLSLEGLNFENVELKYDIYSDEILVNYNDIRIIVLNQELLDSFSFYLPDKSYHFRNFKDEESLNGYYQIIYEGKSKLYKKWRKKRAQFVIEAKYDEFQANHQLVILVNGQSYEISGKRDLLRILSDQKDIIKKFIKTEKIRIDIGSPETIIPVIRYFDSLQEQ